MEAEEFLSKYQHELEKKVVDSHRLRMENSRTKGEEDGKRNLPSVDDQFVTPFEHEIESKYQADIEDLYQNGKQVLDDSFVRNYMPVINELDDLDDEKIEKQIKQAEANKTRKLAELNENHLDTIKDIENSPHHLGAKQRFDKIRKRWDEVTQKHNRQELNIHFKPYWAYILLLFAIGIAEFPLNNQVFLSFRETPLLTLIMSGVLVITLPFLAHAAGKILKQVKERKIYPFLIILLVLVVVSISYLTSVLRTNYVAELGAPDAELMLDQWTFFVIGIILFLVGTIASFFAHDESIEFTEVYHKFHKEEEAYLKIQLEANTKRTQEKENFDQRRKEIQDEFTVLTEGLKNRLSELRTKQTEIAGDYNKTLACLQGLERKLNNYFKEAVFHYRDTNLTYRNNHKQPSSWSQPVNNLKSYFDQLEEIGTNPQKA